MKNKLIIQIVTILLALVLPTVLFAQAPDPGGDPDVPIDGGLSLLLAAGVAYGAKKGYDRQKKNKKVEGNESIIEK